jgi:hypothetical protein
MTTKVFSRPRLARLERWAPVRDRALEFAAVDTSLLFFCEKIYDEGCS